MTKINPNLNIDDEFDPEVVINRRRKLPTVSRFKVLPRSEHAVTDEALQYASQGEVADEEAFRPTYQGSRWEREWILTYLGNFYEQHLLTDVLRRAKGGKEANVYCCLADPAVGLELLAAKLYRPRMLRNLRNDARYRQGRDYLDEFGKVIRDNRLLVAIRKGTSIGKETVHTSWLEHEYHALEQLHAVGCDVPRPVAVGENTILMEYLGDPDRPAPTLHEVRLTVREARSLFDRLVVNLEKMLAAGRVHGDLSAYNVLYWEGTGTIIDFPQAVNPYQNQDAWDIFRRDVTRLCQYFQRYGLGNRPERLASALWDRFTLPRGPEVPLDDEEEIEE
jgi:RIO kinase 1